VQRLHLLVARLVEDAQDLDRLLDRARAPAPAVVGLLGVGRRPRVGGDLGALEIFLDADEPDLEALGARLRFGERDVAADLDLLQIDRTEAALRRNTDVRR
jgi:hypothetical protein